MVERKSPRRLSESEVIEIIREYETTSVSQTELAAKYGLSRSCVTLVVTGRTWSHLPRDPQSRAGFQARQAAKSTEQLFREKFTVAGGDSCWEWTGTTWPNGYGQFNTRRRDGKTWTAHRFAWALTYGPPPDDKVVCHHCDNRRCVRPDHLFLGTQADNMADMVSKGRQVKKENHWTNLHPERKAFGDRNPSRRNPENLPRGESHPTAKVSDEDVGRIKGIYSRGELSQREIAAAFCVSQSHVSQIVRGHTRGVGIDEGARRDAASRHRAAAARRGSASKQSKLTESDVQSIRRRYAAGGISQHKLGLEYGISQTVVGKIVRYKSWAHVLPDRAPDCAAENDNGQTSEMEAAS